MKRRIAVGAMAFVLGAGLAWGQESRTVTIGPEYSAGGFKRIVLGSGYRNLWTTPVRLPVLDLTHEGGGLTPVRQVGQAQSVGLAMKGADGRSYTFRSLHKEPQRMMPEQLRDTWAGVIAHDQTSGTHPAAGVMLPVLAEAARHRAHATAARCHAGRPGSRRIPQDVRQPRRHHRRVPDACVIERTAASWVRQRSSRLRRLWTRLQEDPSIRLDSQALLRARILDLWVENFDRHHGQWRWMKIPGRTGWQPLPEDPDFVFLYRDGLLMHALHSHRPAIPQVGGEVPGEARRSAGNSFEVDRWLLADLTAQDFENAAREVQGRLTDEVIDRALRQMPAERYAQDAPGKLAVLKARRAALVEYVLRVYRFYAKDVDVHASDQADEVAVSRAADDAVEVSIARQGAGAPYDRRRFTPAETGNVRVYLHGGDDHVTRTGRPGGPILIRVIAGSGHDVIDDTGSGGTEVWKDAGSADVRRGDGTRVVGQTWVNPHPVKDAPWIEPRSFGHWTAPAPILSYSRDTQFVLGYGITRTAWGFRTEPAKSIQTIGAAITTGNRVGRLQYEGEYNRAGSHLGLDVGALVSTMEHYHYFGPGNETPEQTEPDLYRTRERVVRAGAAAHYSMGPRLRISLGPVVRHSRTEDNDASLLGQQRPYGTGAFGQLALRGTLEFDSRAPAREVAGLGNALSAGDDGHINGVRLSAGATHVPQVWDVTKAYSSAQGEAAAFVGRPRAHLALRVGGRKLWGDYPWFEAATIGGANNRGFSNRRFAGDASLYGSASFRGWIGDLTIAQIPLRIGVHWPSPTRAGCGWTASPRVNGIRQPAAA